MGLKLTDNLKKLKKESIVNFKGSCKRLFSDEWMKNKVVNGMKIVMASAQTKVYATENYTFLYLQADLAYYQ